MLYFTVVSHHYLFPYASNCRIVRAYRILLFTCYVYYASIPYIICTVHPACYVTFAVFRCRWLLLLLRASLHAAVLLSCSTPTASLAMCCLSTLPCTPTTSACRPRVYTVSRPLPSPPPPPSPPQPDDCMVSRVLSVDLSRYGEAPRSTSPATLLFRR